MSARTQEEGERSIVGRACTSEVAPNTLRRFWRPQVCRYVLFNVAIAALSLLLYASTAQRGISWQDSGEYQYKFIAHAYSWDVGAGVARLHPSYILITRAMAALLPHVPEPYVYTLSSGVGMALALVALSATILVITESYAAAVMAAVLLGGAQMAWWLSTMAEVYTWSLAFFMLEIACLSACLKSHRFRWFVVALFFNGCHFGVHHFALLNLPLYAFLFLRFFSRQASAWLACAGAWCLGAWPILLPIIRVAADAKSAEAFLANVLFGNYFQRQITNFDVRNGPLWLSNMALSSFSLSNPCWLFAGIGMLAAAFRRRAGAVLHWFVDDKALYGSLVVLTGVHFVFWIRYVVPDQATFILPTLGLLAVWSGIGVALWPIRKRNFLICLAIAAGCSVMAPQIFYKAAARYAPPRARVLPYRNEFAYWAFPWKHNENSAERFVEDVARHAYPPKMVAWVDTTAVAPLMVAQAMGRLPSTWTFLTSWQDLTDEEVERRLRESPNGGYVLSPVPAYTPQRVLHDAKAFVQEGCFHRIVW